MGCYKPIPAYQDGEGRVKLGPPVGTENLALPCGKCIGCRTDRATEWAHRCEHEATQYRWNTFLNLTYADDRLPAEGTLRADHLRNFIKRLRKLGSRRDSGHLIRNAELPIRYLACGEYGEENRRPHYHALLFNAGFSDRRRVGRKDGHELYESPTIAKLWPYGAHRLGDATPAAASYIAKYTLKAGYDQEKAEFRRAWACDLETQTHISRDGELIQQPPFVRMSLKPAIGAAWVKAYSSDLTKGFLVTNGRKHAIPRHYRELLKRNDPQRYEEMRANTDRSRRDNPTDKYQADRLEAARRIHEQKKQHQQRSL